MSFLLDTNVISEWVKPRPNYGVIEWLADADEDRLFLSVISLAEIRHGIELLPQGKRRSNLIDWLTDDLPLRFANRIVDVDQRVADLWGVIMASASRRGTSLNPMDSFFAATAKAYDFSLVTRNIGDFGRIGITLVNPWT